MIFKNVKIYTEHEIIEHGWIEILDKKINDFGTGEKEGIDLNGKIIIPGYIDQHFHGTDGLDLMNCTYDAVGVVAQKLLEYGVTSFLPTTLTESSQKITNAIKKIVSFKQQKHEFIHANIVGIHLEGPFINTAFCGAQDINYIVDPSKEQFDAYQSAANGEIKLVTYAIEKGDHDFTKHLHTHGVVPSIGHSKATYEQVEAAIKDGLKSVTHLHNASSPYHHRTPGVVNAGLYFDELYTEIIVDGNHVHKDVLKFIKKVKPIDKIVLVTDSSSATGLKDGNYFLGDQQVIKSGNKVTLPNGVLAGSVLKMCNAVDNMKKYTKSTIEETILMSSSNPATLLGLENKGKIQKGFDADLLVIDENMTIHKTIVLGEIGYEREQYGN